VPCSWLPRMKRRGGDAHRNGQMTIRCAGTANNSTYLTASPPRPCSRTVRAHPRRQFRQRYGPSCDPRECLQLDVAGRFARTGDAHEQFAKTVIERLDVSYHAYGYTAPAAWSAEESATLTGKQLGVGTSSIVCMPIVFCASSREPSSDLYGAAAR